MECDQLYLAAKEGNVATMETLIYDKYVDVNSRTPFEDDHILQVCIYVTGFAKRGLIRAIINI